MIVGFADVQINRFFGKFSIPLTLMGTIRLCDNCREGRLSVRMRHSKHGRRWRRRGRDACVRRGRGTAPVGGRGKGGGRDHVHGMLQASSGQGLGIQQSVIQLERKSLNVDDVEVDF